MVQRYDDARASRRPLEVKRYEDAWTSRHPLEVKCIIIIIIIIIIIMYLCLLYCIDRRVYLNLFKSTQSAAW